MAAGRSAGSVNVNVKTSNNTSNNNNVSNDNNATNDNNVTNDNDISDDDVTVPPSAPVSPQPPLNFAAVPIADILKKKAHRRNKWEEDMVSEYLRHKKELEASQH